MWENETIVLITSLKKRLLAGNNKVRFSRVLADTALPPYIKTLFQSQVEYFIHSESPIAIQSTPHFDLSDNDLANIKDRFFEVFREAALFSNSEVEEILRSALMQRMNYLVKPIATMRRLLFNGDTSTNIDKLNRVLNPFLKLLPYAGNLLEECRRLNYQAIESDEYNNLVNEMLERMTRDEPVKLAIGDFSVLTDFISETKGEDISRVEGQIVQEFMADRNLWPFRRAIDVEMKLGREDFDLVDLEMTLKRYLELKAEFLKGDDNAILIHKTESANKKPPIDLEDEITETEMPEAEDTDLSFEDLNLSEIGEKEVDETFDLEDMISPEEVSKPVEDVKIKPPETNKREIEEGWDLDDVLGSDNLLPEAALQPVEPGPEEEEAAVPDEPKPVEEKSVKPAEPEEKAQPKKQMRIIRRDQNQVKETGSMHTDELSDTLIKRTGGLRQMIDQKTEKVFVKKLFGNDQGAYDHLMKKLEESDSWRVAKILIDNELFKRDVDPFSREAIKLVDMVYSRYYPEEGVGGK